MLHITRRRDLEVGGWSGWSSPCANRGYWMDLGRMAVWLHPAVLRAANPLVLHWTTHDRRLDRAPVRVGGACDCGAGAERERSGSVAPPSRASRCPLVPSPRTARSSRFLAPPARALNCSLSSY